MMCLECNKRKSKYTSELCDICTLEEKLKTYKNIAKEIPKLEKELEKLYNDEIDWIMCNKCNGEGGLYFDEWEPCGNCNGLGKLFYI